MSEPIDETTTELPDETTESGETDPADNDTAEPTESTDSE
jgi:hypothetical protein